MGLNFTPKLAKREVKPLRRSGDPSFMLRLAKKAASLPNVNKALSSIPGLVKRAANVGGLLPVIEVKLEAHVKIPIVTDVTVGFFFPAFLKSERMREKEARKNEREERPA